MISRRAFGGLALAGFASEIALAQHAAVQGTAPADTVLFKGIADQRFYFVHSYAAREWAWHPGRPSAAPLVQASGSEDPSP